jgi:sec-independent protein translocase protein TatC
VEGLVVSDSYLTFTEHLEELRSCLIRSLAAVVVVSAVCYFFSDSIFGFMVAPLKESLPPGQNLIGTTVTEAFFTELKVAFFSGVIFSSPFVFYEIWRFIRPGLVGNEGKYVVPFVIFATLFFISGAFFCYRIVLPVAFVYFIEQYGTMGVTPAIRLGEYFTFFFRMVLAFGITFELPIITLILVRLGVWDHRFMRRSFRYAVIVIFILAAFLTPTPDIINQLLLAVPMLLLYVLSIGVAYIWRKSD